MCDHVYILHGSIYHFTHCQMTKIHLDETHPGLRIRKGQEHRDQNEPPNLRLRNRKQQEQQQRQPRQTTNTTNTTTNNQHPTTNIQQPTSNNHNNNNNNNNCNIVRWHIKFYINGQLNGWPLAHWPHTINILFCHGQNHPVQLLKIVLSILTPNYSDSNPSKHQSLTWCHKTPWGVQCPS